MPPGSASASNPAPLLSKSELDKYYSRVHVDSVDSVGSDESVGSDGEKVLSAVARNLSALLGEYKTALEAQTPGDDQAWTAKDSQEFLTDVIGQVKAILGDKANKLTKDDKKSLQGSLSEADQLKNECNSKQEDVKKAPRKNGNVNLSASETVEKDDKEDHDGDRRLDRPPTSQDSTSRDKVDPPTKLEDKELNVDGWVVRKGEDRKEFAELAHRINERHTG